MLSDGRAQIGIALRGAVVCKAFVKGALTRFNHMRRCFEIRFADLEMNDIPPLRLKRASTREYIEGAFYAQQ